MSGVLVFVACHVYEAVQALQDIRHQVAEDNRGLSTELALSQREFSQLKDVIKLRTSLTKSVTAALDHNNSFVRLALSQTIANAFDRITVEDNRIELKGRHVSEDIYYYFWDELWKKQKALKLAGRSESILIRAVHSSSITLWEQNATLTARQGEFCTDGGQLYRVVVRHRASNEPTAKFSEVLERMSESGVKPFFLDWSERSADASEPFYDFLICKLDEVIYIMEWILHGDAIAGCNLFVNDAGAEGRFFRKWEETVHSLNSLQGADKSSFPALQRRPTEKEMLIMLSSSRT